MHPIRFERLARWGAVAMLLLVVHGLVAPRSAWAGCNHLVTSRADRLWNPAWLDAVVIGVDNAAISDDRAGQPLTDPGPKRLPSCSGPGCSDRSPMPAPTVYEIPDGADQWGSLIASIVPPAAPPRSRTIDEPVVVFSTPGTTIFHPPRD